MLKIVTNKITCRFFLHNDQGSQDMCQTTLHVSHLVCFWQPDIFQREIKFGECSVLIKKCQRD